MDHLDPPGEDGPSPSGLARQGREAMDPRSGDALVESDYVVSDPDGTAYRHAEVERERWEPPE